MLSNAELLTAPLQIDEITLDAARKFKGILYESVWQMVTRRDRIHQGVPVDEPEYTADQGLDRFLPAWAVRKIKLHVRVES